jgi:tetratricopeptide (TPR) repeat protein
LGYFPVRKRKIQFYFFAVSGQTATLKYIERGSKMSFLDSLTSGPKLKAAIKQTTKARNKEGAQADFIFKEAYSSFQKLLNQHTEAANILYHWGFAVLHQAQTKENDEAITLYKEACEKFSFCLTINPDFLGAAIDGGVAFMGLAELIKAKPDDELYESAKSMFLAAEGIQKGSASYNLACIYGLRGEDKACQESLTKSRDHGSLPEKENILNDSDLKKVKRKAWFKKFIESLNTPEDLVDDKTDTAKASSSDSSRKPDKGNSDSVKKAKAKTASKK